MDLLERTCRGCGVAYFTRAGQRLSDVDIRKHNLHCSKFLQKALNPDADVIFQARKRRKYKTDSTTANIDPALEADHVELSLDQPRASRSLSLEAVNPSTGIDNQTFHYEPVCNTSTCVWSRDKRGLLNIIV